MGATNQISNKFQLQKHCVLPQLQSKPEFLKGALRHPRRPWSGSLGAMSKTLYYAALQRFSFVLQNPSITILSIRQLNLTL